MANNFLIYKVCPACNGDGVVTTTSPIPPYESINIECPECLGPNAKFTKAGGLFWGWMEKEK